MLRTAHSKRVIALASALIVPGMMLGIFSFAQEPAVETAGKRFKNIKVLNDLPADKLIVVMRDWNAALGVKCDFCHVKDRSSDEIRAKEAARKMVTMTIALNKEHKVLGGRATCFMCHHGEKEPALKPGAEEKKEEKREEKKEEKK